MGKRLTERGADEERGDGNTVPMERRRESQSKQESKRVR